MIKQKLRKWLELDVEKKAEKVEKDVRKLTSDSAIRNELRNEQRKALEAGGGGDGGYATSEETQSE